MSGHIVPVKHYVLVFLTLIALTGLTTGVAFVDLGPINTVVALAIAICKMLLVVLFFMHLKYSSHLTKIVIMAGLFWLMILLALTLSDVLTRSWSPSPTGWETSLETGGVFQPRTESRIVGALSAKRLRKSRII